MYTFSKHAIERIDSRLFIQSTIMSIVDSLPNFTGLNQLVIVCDKLHLYTCDGESDYDCVVIDLKSKKVVTVVGLRSDQLDLKKRQGDKVIALKNYVRIRF